MGSHSTYTALHDDGQGRPKYVAIKTKKKLINIQLSCLTATINNITVHSPTNALFIKLGNV
jgi:hypothetical protein